MILKCPKCKQSHEVDKNKEGEIFCCLECGQDFVIDSKKKSKVKLYIVLFLIFLLIICATIIGLVSCSQKSQITPKTGNKDDKIISTFDQAKKVIETSDIITLAKYLKTINIDCQGPDGTSLLIYCTQRRDLEQVELLLDLGAKANTKDNKKLMAVHYAVLTNNVEILESLIAKGAAVDDWENPLIGIAAEKGHVETLNFLLSNMGNSELLEPGPQEKAIFRAIYNNQTRCARMLFNKYNLDNIRDKNGNTPLLAAISTKNIELVRLLQERNVDPNIKNTAGDSAFSIAVKSNSADLITAFSGSNVDYSQINTAGMTIPMLAAMNSNIDILQKSLNTDNINATNQEGKTVLFYGCLSGNNDIVDFILERKPDFNNSELKTSPLYAALQSKNCHAVEKLLEHNIPLTLRDDNKNNFLMYSAMTGDETIFSLLLERMKRLQGFDLFEINKNNQNVYDIAVEANSPAIVQIIKPSMADIYYNTNVKPILNNLSKANTITDCKKALTRLDEFNLLYLNDKAKEQISETKQVLTNKIRSLSNTAISSAIESAKKDKYYESAIKILESAIASYPDASNISEAQNYLAEIRKNAQAEAERQAQINIKKKKIAAMSPAELKNEITGFINSWLNDMKLDKSTSSYWSSPILETTLYSVKSWEIISSSSDYSPNYNTITLQIESSTKGGFPIRKNWRLSISRNDDMEWKIMSFNEQ